MEIRRAGASALLLDVGEDGVSAWHAEVLRRRAAGDLVVDDVVPGARTILLDGLSVGADEIAEWQPDAPPPAAGGAPVTLATRYDGADLAAVADAWGMSVEAAVARHSETEFRVAFCGFAPGFAYLTGLPRHLAIPRHATPRTRVPAGSVALADAYCGVYPTASPGGWRLIGRTDAVLFDVDRDPPALLVPGCRVRFTPVPT